MKINRWVWMLFAAGIVMTTSCKDEGNDGENDGFDRKRMLTNYADNLIIPSLNELDAATGVLVSSTSTFAADKNIANLIALQQAWLEAYALFQYTNAWNFGPGGEDGLKKSFVEEIGTFPISETKINDNIAANNANFNDFNRDARGFLAMEYLVFSLTNDNVAVLNRFQTEPNATIYLLALAAHLKNNVAFVKNGWTADYRTSFINNAGTSVGSSTSQLYNEFVRSFETIKNFKLGLPIGNRPGQVTTEPTRVEAYYSGKSVEMMKLHMKAIEDIWYGKSKTGTDGVGFKDYLLSVTGGAGLVTATEAQLAVLNASLNAVPDTRLSEQVDANKTQLENLYVEFQKHTRFFKSDMSSLLGIAITYSSGDGD